MMINFISSTVFNSGAQTITNTINCVGVMGAGLALEFKLRFPLMYEDYKKRCKQKTVLIGEPYLYSGYGPKILIYNFPTKNHWRYPSKIEWIEAGLKHFKKNYGELGIKSIAFPKLGSRNGKLVWEDVKKMMLAELSNIDLDITICLDEEESASGLEAEMIKNIKIVSMGNKKLSMIYKKIETLGITRFADIKKASGVSSKEYEYLFKMCYFNVVKDLQKNNIQTSLFENLI